jgi:valyl-tRNA synthetase
LTTLDDETARRPAVARRAAAEAPPKRPRSRAVAAWPGLFAGGGSGYEERPALQRRATGSPPVTMEKTFDAASEEARIADLWDAAEAFAMGANARPGPDGKAEPFAILLPPPNVTGSLHMGHAFNHTLMDVLVRWKRMQGADVLWQPGLDHAGIATQMVVERELAKAGNAGRRELGREAFVAKVWEWKAQSGGTILEQCKRLGDSFDLSRNRFTMDEGFHDAVLRAFVTLYERGLIFRGKRLVNWDPHFETAISDLEVENVEVPGHMWHFKYPLAGGETYEYVERDADGAETLRETRDFISIATTRPETMLGDGAVAVHPEDARYAPIVGKLCEIPVGPKAHRRLIPIVADEYPDPAFGSGAVKITGAHDFNDYAVAQRHGVPKYRLMDTKAQMRDDGAPYAEAAARARAVAAGAAASEAEIDALNLVPDAYRGLDRFEARARVVADIDAEGLMLAVEAKPIVQPFGDRSKVVIEPMLTDQWFVDAARLAGPALDAVRDGRTRILPESQERTYHRWLEGIEPWCISRQLWWGHQIPVWYGPTLEEIAAYPSVWHGEPKRFCGPNLDAVVAEAAQYYGLSVELDEFTSTASARSYAFGTANGNLASVSLQRDPDVLDTWFSSGIWPIGTLGWPEDTEELRRYYPTSVLVTGFDILFFWVARMMMMQLELTGEVPFRDVYVHPLVRDEKGKKMSKSLGNVLDPIELIDEFGADAVRFTLASMAAMGRDLKLSKDRIAGYRNFGTKLWNAARFAEMNGCKPLEGFDPAAVRLTANRWIVGETGRLRETLDAALEGYRFNDAAAALYAHVWGKVCDWYVELAKPLFDDPAAAAETRATMGWALDQCLILLHSFMPFVTEALWGRITERPKLLAHADWPSYGAELVDPAADDEMGWVIALIEEVRSVRAAMHVPAGAKVALTALSLSDAQAAALERNRAMVARLARIERFETADEAPRGSVALTVGGASLCLPLAEVIDVGVERARLARALDKLEREAAGLRAKLGNAAFVAKAPEGVVDESRARLEAADDEIAILAAALARLASLA